MTDLKFCFQTCLGETWFSRLLFKREVWFLSTIIYIILRKVSRFSILSFSSQFILDGHWTSALTHLLSIWSSIICSFIVFIFPFLTYSFHIVFKELCYSLILLSLFYQHFGSMVLLSIIISLLMCIIIISLFLPWVKRYV